MRQGGTFFVVIVIISVGPNAVAAYTGNNQAGKRLYINSTTFACQIIHECLLNDRIHFVCCFMHCIGYKIKE